MSVPREYYTGFDLAVGSINGLRAFNVDRLGRLQSIHFAQTWKPGENVAKCGSSYSHAIPSERCNCGIYAFYADHDDYEDHSTITGVIEGYGRTIIGTRGFRTEKAKIVALLDPSAKRSKSKSKRAWHIRYGQRYTLDGGFIPFVAHAITTAGFLGGSIALYVNNLTLVATLAAVLAVFDGILAVGVIVGCGDDDKRLSSGQQQTREQLFELVRRNYPDIPVYPSRREMLKAHPLPDNVQKSIPSPETDPNFWTRSV